jgi:hypothetical protein
MPLLVPLLICIFPLISRVKDKGARVRRRIVRKPIIFPYLFLAGLKHRTQDIVISVLYPCLLKLIKNKVYNRQNNVKALI